MLFLAKVLVKNKWTATRISIFYFIFRLLLSFSLFKGSWPIYPPMVILAAIILDIMFVRNLKRVAITSISFTLVFYVSQTIYLSALGIDRFIPKNILEPVVASIFAIFASLFAYFVGERILQHVNEDIDSNLYK